ncbi:MAG: DEAD/DEAH box helicase [Planctomycetota bacterium]
MVRPVDGLEFVPKNRRVGRDLLSEHQTKPPRIGEDLVAEDRRPEVFDLLLPARPVPTPLDRLAKRLPVRVRGAVFTDEDTLRVRRQKTASRTGSFAPSQKPKARATWDLLRPLLGPPLRFEDGAPVDLPHPLYSYQVDGVLFLAQNGSALLADEMGTGKTVMSTVALKLVIRNRKAQRALIVSPLSVVSVWRRHLAEWAPELEVVSVRGGKRQRSAHWRTPAHVHLVTFDTLRMDLDAEGKKGMDAVLPQHLAQRFDVVLLDEAQSVKNLDSGRSRAVRALHPKFRWALSGTPVENRLSDLCSLFAFVRPGLLGDADGLDAREASERIAPFVKRRTKKDVMKELPPKIREELWLELDEHQKEAYLELAELGRKKIDSLGDKASRVHIFAVLSRLQRICNFAPDQKSSPKLRATIERVEQVHANGEKILIFSQWLQDGVDRILEGLSGFGTVRFDARMSPAERERAVTRFREDPGITAFVATVKSAGVGLTLTEANHVVHFDHWWNPAWIWQAEDRAHRRGQTLPVQVASMWMQDTVEQRVRELLEKKGILHDEILGDLREQADGGVVSMGEWRSVLGGQGF